MDLITLGKKLQKKFPKSKELSPEVVAEKWLKMQSLKKKTLKERIIKPIIEAEQELFTGEDHGEAIDEAKGEGINMSEVDRQKDGKFMTTKGRILNRKQSKKEFDIEHSHEIGTDRKFVIVTKDYSGLGFAVQEIEENNTEVIMAYKLCEDMDEDEKTCYNMIGEGLVEKIDLDELMSNRNDYRDYYFIWDGNHNFEEGELLRKEGFKVWGGTEFTFQLENDREFGKKFAESCGLVSPETIEFTSAEEGISFLEEREEEAFVLKPNEESDNSMTYVPISEDPVQANKEVQSILQAYSSHPVTQSYILQKMVQGVEVNVEAFFINGKAYFAHANFEDKFNHQKDTGEATGCAFDVDFEISLYSKLYQETVGKMEEKLAEINYTGLADANVIVADERVYFLEFCFRLGYNAAVNFFFNLCNKTCLQTLGDMIDDIEDITSKSGFGASMTIFTDKYKTGLPIYLPERIEHKTFIFDGYEEDDMLKMAGIGHEIVIVNEHNYTIKTALKDVVDSSSQVVFKNCYFRRDADDTNYQLNPIDRYDGLLAMKYL